MILKNIFINGFGKLNNKSIDLFDKINIIYGKNEAGKSTMHSFIKNMLFNDTRNKNIIKENNKYEPWDKNTTYEGSLTFKYDDIDYVIYKNFNKSEFNIVKSDTKEVIKNPYELLNEAISHLTYNSFRNTICIEQLKSKMDRSLSSELKKIILNVNNSFDISVNSLKALNYLKNLKNELNAKKIFDATDNYKHTINTIKLIEKNLDNNENKNNIRELNYDIKQSTKKIHQNNLEIARLKEEIKKESVVLKEKDFTTHNDIEVLKTETEKLLEDYSKYKNSTKKTSRIIINSIFIFIGLSLSILNTIFLIITYPNIGSTLNMSNIYPIFDKYFGSILPAKQYMLYIIVFLYIISLFLIINGLISIIDISQYGKKADEISYILGGIFKYHLDTNIVNTESIEDFNSYLDKMSRISSSVISKKNNARKLLAENVELEEYKSILSNKVQEKYLLQFEIEKKIEKLNLLKDEAKKYQYDIGYNDSIQNEINGINMSINIINDLISKIKYDFGSYINNNASEYLKGITNGKYSSINIDNNMNITINTNNDTIPIDNLSTGTIDQIYLAIRLAIINIIQNEKNGLPLIFDDCFAMYDNDRLESTLLWLDKNYKNQIIIFTCHTREIELLEKNNIQFNKIII